MILHSPSVSSVIDSILPLKIGILVFLTSFKLCSSCDSLSVVADDGPGAGAGALGAPPWEKFLAISLGERNEEIGLVHAVRP